MDFRLVAILRKIEFRGKFEKIERFERFHYERCYLRNRVGNLIDIKISYRFNPIFSLGVFGDVNSVVMGLFYKRDETTSRALGGDVVRNQSALFADGPLDETTIEAEHRVKLEEEVEEVTTELMTTMSDDLNEMTLESLMAELGLYLPVVEVRLIRFLSLSLVCSL